jgi:hypothetical protein
MSKVKTATVAYEAPHDKKEAAYLGHVRRALDAMGAPNSGELVHNSGGYLTGVYRAGIEPKDAAAVIWHRHCDAGGSRATPCVAEANECGSCSGASEEELRLTSGYGYEYEGRDWGSSKDDFWEIVMLPPKALTHAKFVGTRAVDGVRVGVFATGPGTFYAQTIQSLARGVAAAECPPSPGAPAKASARVGQHAMRITIESGGESASFLAAGEKVEANDSAPMSAPFTRLERQEAAAPEREIELRDDRAIYDYIAPYLNSQNQEVILVLGLDIHNYLKSNTEIVRGQVIKVVVSMEDILAPVIASRPSGFVLIHNHPSGHADPSEKDHELTERVKAAAAVACPETAFLDHLVIGKGEYYSFTDGKLKKV